MTPQELKQKVEQADPKNLFFNVQTMAFFGDTMTNYGVRESFINCAFDESGNWHEIPVSREVWELFRKKPVNGGLSGSAYFNKKTFKRVFPHKGD